MDHLRASKENRSQRCFMGMDKMKVKIREIKGMGPADVIGLVQSLVPSHVLVPMVMCCNHVTSKRRNLEFQ